MKQKTKGFIFFGVLPLVVMMSVYFVLVITNAEQIKPQAGEVTPSFPVYARKYAYQEYIDLRPKGQVLVYEYVIAEYSGRGVQVMKLVGETRDGATQWKIIPVTGGDCGGNRP